MIGGTFAEQEMTEGFLDGLADGRTELPALSNRSEAYQFGWLNGRDDRIHKPRKPAAVLRQEAALIIGY